MHVILRVKYAQVCLIGFEPRSSHSAYSLLTIMDAILLTSPLIKFVTHILHHKSTSNGKFINYNSSTTLI